MFSNRKEYNICERYSARGEDGKVRCSECPLNKSQGGYDFRCKANSHYNKKTKDWEYD